MAFIYDLSDTWNNAGISFNGIKLNATDTASAAGSKLIDLQINGASKFTVGKTGNVIATGLIESTTGGFRFPDGTTQITRAVTSVTSTDGSVAITGTTSVDLSAVFATSASNLLLPVRNTTGATLTKGTAVYISGATGQISTVSKAIATGDATSAQTLGLVTANIANNANGNVTLIGTITNIDTSAYADGQQLYLSPTTAGTLTATKPYAPQHLVYMAVVEHAHPTQGKLFVKVQNGYELDELHDVSAQSPSNNHGIFYNTATSLWENKSIITALGYTPYNATNPAGYTTNVGTVTSVSGTGTVNGLTLTGSVTTSGSLTLGGTLGNIANSQLTNSAITINGTSTALGGSISVGTVTSVAALTLGTSGTDLASSVANGTTTPVITLNVPTASATNRGALSSSDWSTFNAKQAALVSGTNIKTVGGASLLGSGDVGTIGLAYGGTGAATASGARTALGLGTAAVLNAGVASGVATLDGSGTVPTSQLPGAVLGGLNYQGTWNASTNTPTLASSTGSKGYYYVVSVAGSTNLNGITDWKIGDWAVYDGTTWQKVDNTDAVSSVNGYTGAVVLSTSDVAQGTNLYFTQAAARNSVSAGTGISYNSTSGVITNSAPDQTVALTGAGTTVVTGTYPNFTITSNDSTVGTVTSVGGTGTVSGLTLTGTVTTSGNLTLGGTLAVTPSNFASQTANTVLAAPNGAAGVPTFRAIVAADIPTLNQNTTGTASNVTGTVAVANGGTGATTLSSGYLVKGNGTSAVSASVVYDDGTNVGIGTASPGALLDVQQSANASVISRAVNVNVGASADARLLVSNGTTQSGMIMRGTGHASANQLVLFQSSTTAPMAFLTNGSERMRVTSAGLIGIGTTSPSALLHVQAGNILIKSSSDGSNGLLRIENTAGSTAIQSYTDVNEGWFGVVEAKPLSFLTNNTRRMVINGAGDVGIGTASPAYKLDVNGVTRLGAGSPAILAGVGGAFVGGQGELYTVSTNTMGLGTTGAASMQLYTNSVERMRIATSGNVGIGTSSPAVKFVVSNGGAAGLEFDPIGGIGGGSFIQSYNRSTGSYTPNTNFASTHTWYTGATRRMDMDTSGNLGIGTTSPISGSGLTIGNDGSSSATVKQSFSTGGTERAFISLNASSGEMRYSAGYPVYGGFSTFYTVGSERMRIDASGNVGIGTTAPSSKLTVAGSNVTVEAGYGIAFTGDQTRIMTPEDNSYGALINWGAAGGCRFIAGTSERMRIDGVGNVIVGGTAGNGRLTVRGAGTGAAYSFETATSGGATRFIISDNGEASFYNSSSAISMRIASTGEVGIGTTTPRAMLDVGTNASGSTTSTLHLGYSGLNFYGFRIANTMDPSLESAGTLSFQRGTTAAWSSVVTISDVGNVGIGTSSPASKLHVANGSLTLTDVFGLNWGAGSTYVYGSSAANFLGFATNNAERMRIDGSGNVGIGTTAPGARLQVGGSTAASQIRIYGGAAGSTSPELQLYAASSDHNWTLVGNHNAALTFNKGTFGNVGAELMRISSNGDVGIGTSSPTAQLHLAGPANLKTTNASNTSGFEFGLLAGNADANGYVYQRANAALIFGTNNNDRMRITGAGDVGIGTTAPDAKLTVNSTSGLAFALNSTGDTYIQLRRNGVNGAYFQTTAGGAYLWNQENTAFLFGTNNVERMRISAAGYLEFPNSTFTRPGSTGQYIVGAANGGFYQQDGTNYYTVTTSGGSTSDATLKKDVQQLEGALQKICAVRGVSFEFIEQPLSTSDCGTQIGVIAQEIEAQFPEIVVTHENGTKAVRYDRLVAPLIEAIKELTARVAQLEGN